VEKLFHFRSYDGTQLEGTLASGDRSRDAFVLMVHGINSSRDELGLFSGFAEYLASAGFSSFRFDYRCHGVNSQPMESLTLCGIVNDIEAAAQCALDETGVSKIHIVGMSFGGGTSAYWAGITKQKVASVVLFAPVLDYEEDVISQHGLLSNGKLNEKSQDSLQKRGYLETDGVRYGAPLINELRYISGVEGLPRLKCDALILHGDADSIVPYESSQRFVTLNPRAQLKNIPGTDHGFGVEDDEDLTSAETKAKHAEVYRIVVDFFEKSGK
jgi:pimeloyl-ACP methyl ester carboxylesterase